MARHVVARVEEIPPGGRKIVRIEGREVGVFNLDGEFYALKNSCPHQAARVCLGRVMGTMLPSDVYEFNYGEEGRILRCPWHSWEYDIRTGQSVFDKNVRLVTYRVDVSNGEVAVSI
jgi:nitrite reductase/ring-hydroxylating ferredoxin subunit